MPAAGGAFVQAESEVAASNMLLGAAACGVRALITSSSPGVSLMQEAISYMAGSELPGVLVNMNRGGPGLGDIGPSQGDYFQSVKGGGHGDYRTMVLAPATCQECYDLTVDAFDLAYKYRNPVLILGDAIVGQMKEPVTPREPVTVPPAEGGDWKLTGRGDRAARSLKSLYLTEGALAGQNLRLQDKYRAMRDDVRYEDFETADAEVVVVAYGSIGRIAKSAVRALRAEGLPVGLLRPITLYPFPEDALRALAGKGKRFLTIEHNLGQMVEDVRLAVRGWPIRISSASIPATCRPPTHVRSPSARPSREPDHERGMRFFPPGRPDRRPHPLLPRLPARRHPSAGGRMPRSQ